MMRAVGFGWAGGAFALWLSLALLPGAAAFQEKPLPEGAGKETLQKVCTNCHDLESVIGARRTRLDWQRVTEDMMSRGADGSQDDMAAIVSYLTTNFGKINVNTATAAELEKTLEFSSKEAQAIVEFRGKNGQIADFEQLKKVPGVSTEKLEAKRPFVAFSL